MMIAGQARRALRKGFTLIELLVVITIILLISGIFLSLTPGNGGGLPAGQQMLASSIRSLRAMALMNRGVSLSGVSYNSRYRLLILNDPTDQANHLRQFVVAIGGSSDPNSTQASSTTAVPYTWFSPDSPSVLPTGVYFMPPDATTKINPPAGGLTDKRSLASGLSIIGPVAGGANAGEDRAGATPPSMTYAPLNQPTPLSGMASLGAKNWYCIELQSGGASNHLGRVVLVLGTGNARLNAGGNVEIDLDGDYKLAAISLRPNGDVSLTNDSDDLTKKTLK